MKMELRLDGEGIDRACEEADAFLSSTNLSGREVIAGRFSFENVLLMWRQHYGEDSTVRIRMGKRFGKPSLVASVRGDPFDPRVVNRGSEKYIRIARATLEASGFIPSYSYRGGYNIVALTRPRPPLSSLSQILIAFLLGLAVALLGNAFLSDASRTYVIDKITTPLFDVFLAMLSGLAGPLIFLTVAWGVCGIGDVTILGRSGKTLVGRLFAEGVLATIFACLVCIPFFALSGQGVQGDEDVFGDLLMMLVEMLPTNLFKAFVDGNTSQIILIGIFVGITALVLGDACDWVRKGIEELNAIVQFLMEQLCRFIPAFIFVMVISQIWSGTFMMLLNAWVPFLIASALIAAFFVGRIVFVSLRYHVPLRKIISALRPAMILGLTTASSCAAIGEMVSGCKDDLGVDEEQTSFGIPLGLVLCQSSTVIMLVTLVMYCMQSYGIGADIAWYVRMAIMCLLYSMVAPPVPGGMLACIGLMFTKLGVPIEALAMATAFNVIFDYILTCFRVGLIMNNVFDASCAIGAVDRSKFEDV